MADIYICAIKDNQKVFYSGYGERLTGKGLGSGALTGTNRVPVFSREKSEAKKIETYIDAKRITAEIIDAIKYNEINGVQAISVYFNKN